MSPQSSINIISVTKVTKLCYKIIKVMSLMGQHNINYKRGKSSVITAESPALSQPVLEPVVERKLCMAYCIFG